MQKANVKLSKSEDVAINILVLCGKCRIFCDWLLVKDIVNLDTAIVQIDATNCSDRGLRNTFLNIISQSSNLYPLIHGLSSATLQCIAWLTLRNISIRALSLAVDFSSSKNVDAISTIQNFLKQQQRTCTDSSKVLRSILDSNSSYQLIDNSHKYSTLESIDLSQCKDIPLDIFCTEASTFVEAAPPIGTVSILTSSPSNSPSYQNPNRGNFSSQSTVFDRCINLKAIYLEGSDCIQHLADERDMCTFIQSLLKGPFRLQILSFKNCVRLSNACILLIPAAGNVTRGLEVLNLAGCRRITDGGVIPVLSHCTGLKSLNLHGCLCVGAATVMHLAKETALSTSPASGLEYLDLGGCIRVTDASLMQLAQQCRSLQSLNLFSCTNATDLAVMSFAIGCRSLTSLNLSGCCQISDECLIQLANSPTSPLRSINLFACTAITDTALMSLASSVKLSEVNISGCLEITDAAVMALATKCGPYLTSVSLAGCFFLTDIAVTTLASCAAKSLQRIDLGGCLRITDSAIIFVAQSCAKSLRWLNLSGCALITDEAVIFLVKTCLALRVLDLHRCEGVSPLACYSLPSLNSDLRVLYSE